MADDIVRMRGLLFFSLMVVVGLFGVFIFEEHKHAALPAYLTVTFFDVGQGDSVLIETPDGVQVLIDGGPDVSVLRALPSALPWYDRTIDMVVGTHPDKDHIGGLIPVLKRYTVDTILVTENRGETTTATAYQQAVMSEGTTVSYARAGQVYALGASTTLTILSPAGDPSMLESNTASIVAKLTYGEVDIMLTGDAPASIEQYLTTTHGQGLHSEVLKLGHHGSDTSSSEAFLSAVAPALAIVSAGVDNTYGHPHQSVVERVQRQGSLILSTAVHGNITLVSDGKGIWEVE